MRSERKMNMNPITRTLNVDNLLLLALQEDISSEDVTTNAVMPEACQGTVQLLCKPVSYTHLTLPTNREV